MQKFSGFLDKIAYVFSPKENKGTSWAERYVTTFFLKGQGAWVAREDEPQEKRVIDAVATLSQKGRVEPPNKILIYQSAKPNAAMMPNGTMVVCTDLMRVLSDEQMEAVIGHELSHRKHSAQDQASLLAISGAVWLAGAFLSQHLRKNKRYPELLETAGEIAGEVGVAGIVSVPYRRNMEYQADKEGAGITSPAAMISGLKALEKRSKEYYREEYQKKHGKNADPNKPGLLETGKQWLQRNLDSHPTYVKRIEALKKMEQGAAGEHNEVKIENRGAAL